jgi:hypothetical protein
MSLLIVIDVRGSGIKDFTPTTEFLTEANG